MYIFSRVNIFKKKKHNKKHSFEKSFSHHKVFESGKKAEVQPMKFLLEHLR